MPSISEPPAKCTKCGAFGLIDSIVKIKREDGSETAYCKRCYDAAIREGKKIQIIGEL